MIDIKNLKPFPKFCYSIGYIPTSYKVSMTYEEQLIWLCDYLENTVIPAINNNAHATEELQNLFVELKQYVDDYFENLDVQTEINNKLDDMAEAGTLTELITDYLNLKCILAFDSISDMVSATNLIDGSFTKTYGHDTINDGYGEFYYVRTITNADVVDGENIIALSDPSLVAIKINDFHNNSLFDTILIGDSYGVGGGPEPLDYGWCSLFKQKLNLDSNHCFIFAQGGCGFVDDDPYSFLELLVNNSSSITHPERVKNIFVAGGYNDKEFTFTEIQNKIIEFSNYVALHFPNATIYIAHIAWNTGINGELRRKLIENSLRAYSTIPSNCKNMVYLNGTEFAMLDRTLTQSDYIHPNLNGLRKITDFMFQSFKSGNTTFYSPQVTTTMTASNNPTSGSLTITENVINDILKIQINNVAFQFASDIPFTPISSGISLGTISTRFLQPTNAVSCSIPVVTWIGNSDGVYGGGPAELLINPNGSVSLFPFYVDKDGSMISKYNTIRILATSITLPMLYN